MSQLSQFVSKAKTSLSIRVSVGLVALCCLPVLLISYLSYDYIWGRHLQTVESELNSHVQLVQTDVLNQISRVWLNLEHIATNPALHQALEGDSTGSIKQRLASHLTQLGPKDSSYLQIRGFDQNAKPVFSVGDVLDNFYQQQFAQIQSMQNDFGRSAFIIEHQQHSLAVFSMPVKAESNRLYLGTNPNQIIGFLQLTINPDVFYRLILDRYVNQGPQVLFTDESGLVRASNLSDKTISAIENQQLSFIFKHTDSSLIQMTFNQQSYGLVLSHFINRQLLMAFTLPDQLTNYRAELVRSIVLYAVFVLIFIFASCYILIRNQYQVRMQSLLRLVALFDRQELVLSSPPKRIRDEMDELKTDLLGLAEKLLYRRQRLRSLAFTDTLTQLTNRSGFIRDINSLITNSEQQNRNFCLLFIDLDGFKYINDSFGHDTGDQVLKVVAENFDRELQQVVARLNSKYIQLEQTHLYRLGGDEFTIVLEQYHGKDAIISVCDAMLQSFDQRINIAEHSFKLSCSIGIANYPEHGKSREQLLQHADIAMYVAKDAGRNNYMVFDHLMLEQEQRRNLIRDSFSHALAKQELECNLQGLYRTQSLDVIGFEILMRWKHTALGYISPMEFIPLLEETEHIHLWGQWITRRAFEIVYRLNQEGREMNVSINVAIAQLSQGDFVNFVFELQRQMPIPSELICFEITESTVTDCGPKALAQIHQLRDLGYHIAIDDFGTGLSSLARLQQLPISILKIDRSFIQGLNQDRTSAAIVQTTLALAKSMKLQVIAEGVEEMEHVEWFKQTQCEYLQGYALQKPCTEHAFIASLPPLNSLEH
ncbi:EAL domain-containing protein [Alginatibacterium sediminis]|uniref:EAL domain-containing protein n=1 Tax=Alginatibacterium sediminis TaxID=2164068 RepID=A0A420E9A3_9ALTE|nr:EAL domain-containing protein [Alginatibacterium sediminis]RKF15672.1 EAL domain-containing protein [Alginatibacterium sediminis]